MKRHRFEFIQGSMTGYQIEHLLRHYGIQVSGRRADGKRIKMCVPGAQKQWAEYILLRAGVQPISPSADSRNADYAAKHAPGSLPTSWGVGVRRRGLMTMWVDFLGAILGARGDIWQDRIRQRRRR